jgi:hypothetical protein
LAAAQTSGAEMQRNAQTESSLLPMLNPAMQTPANGLPAKAASPWQRQTC